MGIFLWYFFFTLIEVSDFKELMMVPWKRKWDFGSAFLSSVTAENPHIPMTCHCGLHCSQQSMVGGSPQVSAWWWERHTVPPKEAWVVHLWTLLQLIVAVSLSGLPFTCLWGHCNQNNDLPWGAMSSAREKNEFSLAFLHPGGNSKATSEPRVYRTETWPCSATGALCETCRKQLQEKAALGFTQSLSCYKSRCKALEKEKAAVFIKIPSLDVSCMVPACCIGWARKKIVLWFFRILQTFPNCRNVSCRRKLGISSRYFFKRWFCKNILYCFGVVGCRKRERFF